jgi:hypothetical protein
MKHFVWPLSIVLAYVGAILEKAWSEIIILDANALKLSNDCEEYFDKKGTILKDQLDLSILEKSLKKAYKKVYLNARFFGHRIMHLVRNPCLPEVKMLFKGLAVIIKNKFFS